MTKQTTGSGKGSLWRDINRQKYAENYDKIFRKDLDKDEDLDYNSDINNNSNVNQQQTEKE